jgi:hypothetical protein
MPDESSDSLISPDDELMELLKWMAQYAPMQVPGAIFQLFCAKILVNQINQWKEKLDHEISELMKKLHQ